VAEFGSGEVFARRLEEAGIIVTHATLPDAHGREGLRLGSQEVTRMGATEATMVEVAGVIADVVLARRDPATIAAAAASLAATFGPVGYTWTEQPRG